ncbi:MAG: GNAT family N-acetyltransferase [Dehalococcoidia bacterium]|nr:GNAT family N-acetyltransferase [Dehalococcoidia bacterium]
MHGAHIAAMRLVAAALPGAETARVGEWFVYDAGVENPDFNVAYVAGDSVGATGQLSAVAAWFTARGADWRFKLRAGTDDGVIAALAGRTTEAARREPFLAISLDAVGEDPLEGLVAPVRSGDDLAAYESFDLVRGRPAEWSIAGAVMDLPGCWLWLARAEDGTPVARAMSVALGPVATIHNVFVGDAVRRQGYGRAVTAAALRAALRAGCTHGGLGASELGYPLYLAMGFERRYDLATFAPSPPPVPG